MLEDPLRRNTSADCPANCFRLDPFLCVLSAMEFLIVQQKR